jgi:hypothetical protein
MLRTLNSYNLEVTCTITHKFKLGCFTLFFNYIHYHHNLIIFLKVLAMPSSLKEENINFTTVGL